MQTLAAAERDAAESAEEAGDERDAIRQLVAVRLGDENYALGIEGIEGVIAPQPITRVPRTPDHVAGIINLRGRIVPIVDLRARFGLPPAPPEVRKRQRIVIARSCRGLTAGLVVDSVSDVLRLPESRIEPPSFLIAGGRAECITGIGRVGADRLVILLDIQAVLASSRPALDATLAGSPSEKETLPALQEAPEAAA